MKRSLHIYLFSLTMLLCVPFLVSGAEAWPGGSATIVADAVAESLGEGYEPSGVVWDEDRDTLFIVGDDGDLDELSSDGTVLRSWNPGGDLEGVTLNTGDDSDTYVYIGVEHPDSIKQFDPSSGSLTGLSWNLTPWMTGDDNQGLEALTFVPNGEHPYSDSDSGGLFYAGLQATGAMYVFDIDTDANGTYTHIDTIASPIGSDDLAGLTYFNGVLYGVDDNSDLLWTADTAGTLMETYELFGTTEEGIALDPTCPGDRANVFIANDVIGGDADGDVRQYPNFPVTCPAAQEDVEEEDTVGNEDEENLADGDETPSEIVGGIVVRGNTLTIAMEDGVTVTRQPFSEKADLQAAITPDGKRVVVGNGKRVVVYRGTAEVRRKKMRAKRLPYFSLGVQKFSPRKGQTIILAGRRGKKESVTIARLTKNDRVKTVSTKRVYKKKNVRSFRIRKREKARFVVYFGSTKTHWRITPAGKLKRRSAGDN